MHYRAFIAIFEEELHTNCDDRRRRGPQAESVFGHGTYIRW